MDKGLVTRLAIFAIIGLIIIWILTTIFKRVGIIKSDEQKEVEKLASGVDKIQEFNPLLNQTKTFKKLSDVETKQAMIRIAQALGGLGTDESSLFGVFKTLDNKLQISQIAELWYKIYGTDLLEEIKTELREKELAQLNLIIKNLKDR